MQDILEPNQLIVGECASVMAEWPAECVDLTVTAPPYDNLRSYRGHDFDFDRVAEQLWRITKVGGVVAWNVKDQILDSGRTLASYRQAIAFQDLGFTFHDVIIVHLANVHGTYGTRYTNQYEHMMVIAKGRPKTVNLLTVSCTEAGKTDIDNTRSESESEKITDTVTKNQPQPRGNVWSYHIGYGHHTTDKMAYQHPAIMHENLAKDIISSWSNPGDLVLDPMVGSGTTTKMAAALGRDYIGIDVSPKYIDLATKRMQE